MRNGRLTLRRLGNQMLRRFGRLESTQRQMIKVMRKFGSELRGAKGDIKALFDTVAGLDDDLRKHKRDGKAHGNGALRP